MAQQSTATATTEVTITSHTRSLGYGWTTQPSGDGTAISPVSAPGVVGTPRQIEDEIRRVSRIVGSAYSRSALFVGGRRIVTQDRHEIRAILDALAEPNGRVTVTVVA